MRWVFDRIHDYFGLARDRIGDFTTWCNHRSHDCMGIPFVKDIFPAVFNWLYNMGWQIRYIVIDMRDRFDDVGDFLDGIDDGWKLDDLISNIFGGWRELTDNGKQFVFNKLTGFWPDFYWFYQDPGWMLEFWLTQQWGWLQDWLDDRKGAIFQGLTDYWPDFYWFYQDPGYMLEFWLTEARPGLADFLFDMDGWVLERIEDWFDLPEGFSDDPVGWVFDTVKEKLTRREPTDMSWLYDFGEHLLRYFIEGVW